MRHIRTLALGAVLAFSSVAGAQSTQEQEKGKSSEVREGRKDDGKRGMKERGMRRKHMGGRLFNGITLTDAQKGQVKAITAKYRAEFQALRPAMEKGRENGARPDSAARAHMKAQHMEIAQREMAELRAVLTPEQQVTFDGNQAKMRDRANEWRGKRDDKRSGKESRKGR